MKSVVVLALLQAAGQSGAPAYNGFAGETTVQAVQVHVGQSPQDPSGLESGDVDTSATSVVVDGLLDEPAWMTAATLTGFSQYSPQDGLPAQDSTRVRVWYSPQALYFGIEAFADPATVRATLADRDRIDADDQILLLIDTFDDARRALVFGVNPLGIQLDGTRLEGQGSRDFFAAEDDVHPLDRNPDYVYESAGRLTESGFVVEVRIPFKTLPYQSADIQDWGLNVVRIVQATGHSHTWTPARQGTSSFLAQSGTLAGLTNLERGLVLDLTPVVTARAVGAPVQDGAWDYTRDGPEVGGSVRWGITENLTLNGTVNPDFSQVEADAEQLVFDPRSAVFFPEKRPFFLEGSERFRVPNGLIYSRSIVRPEFAAKISGKVSSFDLGTVLALDDRSASRTGDRPVVGLFRATRDIGEASSIGLVYTDRTDGDESNRVGGLDTRLVSGDYTVSLQGAVSANRGDGFDFTGHLWDAGLSRAGRRFGFQSRFRGTSADFVAASGFLSRVGNVFLQASPRLTWLGDPDDRVESYSSAINLSASWLHDAFFDGEKPEDIKLHLNNSWALRGGWQLGASVLIERFWYLPYLYPNIRIASADPGGAPEPFVGRPAIDNYDLVLTANTPQWSTISADMFFIVGRDVNFDEWAEAYIVILQSGLDWRPTDQIRVNPTYLRQQYMRPDGGGTVRQRDIPRLKVEYQVSRSFFVRVVGQYDAFWRDALRDDTRTNRPLLAVDAEGNVAPLLESGRNRIQGDVLLSYRPTPGTVVFAGYGSTSGEEDRFSFRNVRRSADGFFLKFSYLIRR